MSDPAKEIFAAMTPLLDAIGGDPVGPDEMVSGDIQSDLGSPLADLDRVGKQIAVRMLDEQGAFLLRKSIEYVADAMDVSRITIYNYLNAIKG